MSAAAEALPEILARLKLGAMRDRLDSLLDEAAGRGLSLREALQLLCEAEVARREERRIQMGISIAKFPYLRTLEAFDFEAQPSLDPKQVRDLATCRWVANGDALLLLGPPGVGKSHLAVALGREAIRHGYSVLFVQATALITALARGHAEGRLEERLAFYAKPKLLIVDGRRHCLRPATCPSSRTRRTCSSSWSEIVIHNDQLHPHHNKRPDLLPAGGATATPARAGPETPGTRRGGPVPAGPRVRGVPFA